jgi:twinkle protein
MLVEKEQILKAKAKLGDENAEIIADLLNLEKYDSINKKALCCWHPENSPSFIYNQKNYSFHCFGCGKNTDIIDAYIHKGETYLEAVQRLFDAAKIPFSFGEKGVQTKHQYKYPNPIPIKDKQKVYSYLGKRCISQRVIDAADVREDEHGNIAFNYYDANDVLCLVKYRPSHQIDKEKGEIKSWCQKGSDTTPLLFNMSRINVNAPLLICEGEIDCLAAIESGFANAVSVPFGANNYSWIEENFDWLEQFNSIIICADNDEAGIKMQKECVYRLGSWRTKFVDIPPVHADGENKKLMNDLNHVLFYEGKEAVLNLIMNAKDSPVDSVLDFSEIVNVDLDEIDGINIGIPDLDSRLMKLFYGTFTIITGVNGSGKSSFLSQLICNAIDEEKNAFLYSGELPNFQSKNWVNYILAGQRNVKEYSFNGARYWKVTQEAQTAINNYYRGKLFIYKDGYDHKIESLLKAMEDTTRRFGCKLHVIDNLTAINLEANDQNKFIRQELLVTRLIEFAKKYNVAVLLVVHPHKIEQMRRLNKMDVQGISAIIDLAHRILSLYRVTEEDRKGIPSKKGTGWYKEPINFDVLCDILKDRLMGHEGGCAGLYYDKPSRRFYSDEVLLDKKYGWDKTEYKTPLPYPPIRGKIENEVYGNAQGETE